MAKHDSDARLIPRLLSNEAAAVVDFVEGYGRSVKRYLLHCHRVGGDVDDLVQETLLAALLDLEAFEGMNLRPWVIAIARNKALTFINTSARRGQILRGADVVELISVPLAPDESDPILSKTLRGALAQLEPLMREALYLHVVDDWTIREVARHQDVPMGTAATRIRIARERMRPMLERAL